MKRKQQIAAVMALALSVALPLAAQTSKFYRDSNGWVEEVTGTLPGARSLRVNTDSGSVNVQGGTQKDITYTIRKRIYTSSEESGRRYLEHFKVSASKRGDQAVFEGSWEGGSARKFSADFDIQVPRELELARVNTDGGSINVKNLAGRVDAESGGGSVQLADLGGPVSAETGGGAVDVRNASGELNLRTGGGTISISGSKGRLNATTGGGNISVLSATDEAKVETGGGSIEIKSCGGVLWASTGGGSIEVGDVNGRAELQTGGGSIRLASAKGPVVAETGAGSIELWKLTAGARAETGAGSITAEFLGGGQNRSLLQTSVGDVIVYISPNAKFTVKAQIHQANGHRIRSEFPDIKVTSEGDWVKNVYANGSLNGGGPVLEVETMSGNIEFRRSNH